MTKKILTYLLFSFFSFLAFSQYSYAACSVPDTTLEFVKSSYSAGETIQLRGGNASMSWAMCLYQPGGKLANKTTAQSSGGTFIISSTATEGHWTGIVLTGSELTSSDPCPSLLPTSPCNTATTVTASTTGGGGAVTPPPASSAGYQCGGSGNAEDGTDAGRQYCDDVCDMDIDNYCAESPCLVGSDDFCDTATEACACSAFEEEIVPSTCAAGDGCLSGCSPVDPDCSTTGGSGTGWHCSTLNGNSYARPQGATNVSQYTSCSSLGSSCMGCSASTCGPYSGASYCNTAAEACACSTTTGTGETGTTGAATGGSYVNPIPGIHTLTEAATVMIQAILGLIGTIALLFLIIAGIMYITAAGEEEKIKAAKRIITGTIVGLGIALLAFSFLQVIVEILG